MESTGKKLKVQILSVIIVSYGKWGMALKVQILYLITVMYASMVRLLEIKYFV